jgi:hypothetical protein
MEQLNINLRLVVFSSSDRVRIVNIQDFEGLDMEISAFGFDANGEPITSSDQIRNVKYKVTGASHSGVFLNPVFSHGLSLEHKHNTLGNLISGEKVFGWNAVAMQLSRNGCYADPKTIQEATENLIRSGINRVHYYREANINGMAQDYGMFKDHWIVSGDVPQINYDIFNKLLKKISSAWRIQTAFTMKLLRKLELQKLTQETENL